MPQNSDDNRAFLRNRKWYNDRPLNASDYIDALLSGEFANRNNLDLSWPPQEVYDVLLRAATPEQAGMLRNAFIFRGHQALLRNNRSDRSWLMNNGQQVRNLIVAPVHENMPMGIIRHLSERVVARQLPLNTLPNFAAVQRDAVRVTNEASRAGLSLKGYGLGMVASNSTVISIVTLVAGIVLYIMCILSGLKKVGNATGNLAANFGRGTGNLYLNGTHATGGILRASGGFLKSIPELLTTWVVALNETSKAHLSPELYEREREIWRSNREYDRWQKYVIVPGGGLFVTMLVFQLVNTVLKRRHDIHLKKLAILEMMVEKGTTNQREAILMLR